MKRWRRCGTNSAGAAPTLLVPERCQKCQNVMTRTGAAPPRLVPQRHRSYIQLICNHRIFYQFNQILSYLVLSYIQSIFNNLYSTVNYHTLIKNNIQPSKYTIQCAALTVRNKRSDCIRTDSLPILRSKSNMPYWLALAGKLGCMLKLTSHIMFTIFSDSWVNYFLDFVAIYKPLNKQIWTWLFLIFCLLMCKILVQFFCHLNIGE